MYDEIVTFVMIAVVVIAGMPLVIWMLTEVMLFIGEFIDFKRNGK